MRYPLPCGSHRRLRIPHHYSAVGASVKGRFVGIKGLSAFSESIKSCVRAVSLFYFDILEVVGYMHMIRQIWNPSNSCLPAAVGHMASVLEKRNPLNIPGWVQLHRYLEIAYKTNICFVGNFCYNLCTYPTVRRHF